MSGVGQTRGRLIDENEINPFEDPAVLEAMRAEQRAQRLDDYNAYISTGGQQQPALPQAPSVTPTNPAPPPAPSSQPAVVTQTTLEPPPPYTPAWGHQGGDPAWNLSVAQAAAESDLVRRQEELERKAADLQRREDELMRTAQGQVRANNFPPLPASCPVQPCFYQDINVDIPLEFQKVVRYGYYLWIGGALILALFKMSYISLLGLNVIGSLAYFIASAQTGASNNSGVTFGMSIFDLMLFSPCSFVCWFRPLYKAFRSDSSFNFFFFFFVFFFQFCVCVIQCLGIDGWGTVGFISSLGMFTKGHGGATFAGVIMFLIGCLFAAMALLDMLILLKVHRIYRSTGASFAKAQQEFAHDVMGNRAVQQTAGNLAASAARSSVEQTWGTSRY